MANRSVKASAFSKDEEMHVARLASEAMNPMRVGVGSAVAKGR